MGIPVGSKTVNLELRYSAVNVTKNLNTGKISVTIPYQIGFFDEQGSWVTESAGYITATDDAALILFGVTPAMVGGDASSPIGELINKLAYAIVTKQIRVTSNIIVQGTTSTDTTVPAPTSLIAKVMKDGDTVITFPVEVGTESPEFPALLGATIVFEADGFEPVSLTVPVLQGLYTITSLTFTPAATTTTTATTTPNTTDPNDPGAATTSPDAPSTTV